MNELSKKFEKRNALAWFFSIGGLVVVIINLFQPPMGEINTSVLAFFGEICILVGGLLGIDAIYAKKIDRLVDEIKSDKKSSQD